jgi:hypothetical protein
MSNLCSVAFDQLFTRAVVYQADCLPFWYLATGYRFVVFLPKIFLNLYITFNCLEAFWHRLFTWSLKLSFLSIFTPNRVPFCSTFITVFSIVTYDKQTISYYGAHLWNQLPMVYKDSIDLKTFKRLISVWEGPSCQWSLCSISLTWPFMCIYILFFFLNPKLLLLISY